MKSMKGIITGTLAGMAAFTMVTVSAALADAAGPVKHTPRTAVRKASKDHARKTSQKTTVSPTTMGKAPVTEAQWPSQSSQPDPAPSEGDPQLRDWLRNPIYYDDLRPAKQKPIIEKARAHFSEPVFTGEYVELPSVVDRIGSRVEPSLVDHGFKDVHSAREEVINGSPFHDGAGGTYDPTIEPHDPYGGTGNQDYFHNGSEDPLNTGVGGPSGGGIDIPGGGHANQDIPDNVSRIPRRNLIQEAMDYVREAIEAGDNSGNGPSNRDPVASVTPVDEDATVISRNPETGEWVIEDNSGTHRLDDDNDGTSVTMVDEDATVESRNPETGEWVREDSSGTHRVDDVNDGTSVTMVDEDATVESRNPETGEWVREDSSGTHRVDDVNDGSGNDGTSGGRNDGGNDDGGRDDGGSDDGGNDDGGSDDGGSDDGGSDDGGSDDGGDDAAGYGSGGGAAGGPGLPDWMNDPKTNAEDGSGLQAGQEGLRNPGADQPDQPHRTFNSKPPRGTIVEGDRPEEMGGITYITEMAEIADTFVSNGNTVGGISAGRGATYQPAIDGDGGPVGPGGPTMFPASAAANSMSLNGNRGMAASPSVDRQQGGETGPDGPEY